MTAPSTATEAVELIRDGSASIVTLSLAGADGVNLDAFAPGAVGTIAAELPSSAIAFVYGAVLLDESKGGLDVASESLARRKLVLLTWVGQDVAPTDRGKVSEMRASLRERLPALTAHVELQASSAAEAEHASIVERVKTASGAFYDSGAQGADQTVESCAAAMSGTSVSVAADPADKPKGPGGARGGRRLVKRSTGSTTDE